MKKQNEVKCKSVIRRETFQRTGKLPDCTNQQPKDEEMSWESEYDQWRKDFDFTKIETRKEIDKLIDAKLIELLNKQSAKLKEQADEIYRLNINIDEEMGHVDKYVEENRKLSSLIGEAVKVFEGIISCIGNPLTKYPEIVDYVYSSAEEELKKLEQFTKEDEG